MPGSLDHRVVLLERAGGGRHNLTNRDRPLQHEEPKLFNRVRRHGMYRGQDEDAIRLHQYSQVVQRALGIRKPLQIDDRETRFPSGPQILAHHGPGVCREHLESFFDQLRAKERPGLPHRDEQNNIRVARSLGR